MNDRSGNHVQWMQNQSYMDSEQPRRCRFLKFPVVEKRWRAACNAGNDSDQLFTSLPTNSDLTDAFLDRKHREGSARGFGIRKSNSTLGSDSWVDDPITRHVVGLYINKEEEDIKNLLWPLILHTRGLYSILILPMVEPRHLKAYARLCKRSDCGTALGMDDGLSSLLLDLPSVTGAFMVAHAIGDLITGDTIEPEVIDQLQPMLQKLGLGHWIKMHSEHLSVVQCPLVGTFYYGTPLDLNYSNIFTIKSNGFSATDLPPSDQKQPAWKPYLYKGKQRILFTIHETIHAALYDRDEIPDSISVSGQINCRADLEGLPDVSFPLGGLQRASLEVLSYHPCAQVSDQGLDKQGVMFSPPLGNFVLMRYQATCALGPPLKGFYQLSMVSEDKGAFLFKLHLMEGYKAPLTMEFCTVTMPFPRRRIVSLDGTPSVGTVSTSEHSVEWKIVTSGRGLTGKSIEVTFPGTVKFAPWKNQRLSSSMSSFGIDADEDSDNEADNASNMVNEEHLMEKMNKDLPPVDLEEPFCWQAYNYAKVSFKVVGASVSGIAVDPKSVGIYPAVKAPMEFSTQVTSGDYILWNTLGKCPNVATIKR
ncbi:AP-5 complex subunit mu isoform X3 [Vigna radiata var. radiata]|uniref:AP-5 complex subunit mu isoform X3 n=1 Tax=Vigna radiata var. radiata TaxID=3916 RepID=A0A3Q0FB08_VIGRR|nr:AP-5 complex subunit mu isoform X3 [Vigna radiata var. radiata]